MRYLVAAVPFLLMAVVRTQCQNLWASGNACNGVDREVRATTLWDPDGPGPLPVQLVAGGLFTLAGTASCRGLARCDLATGVWTSLSSSPFDAVTALAVLPTGQLVVAGWLQATAAEAVATYDGVSWQLLNSAGLAGILALHVRPNGDLLVAGTFGTSPSALPPGLARWNGANWVALGPGWTQTPATIRRVAEAPNGDLIVAGVFFDAASLPQDYVARWNGVSLTPLSGLTWHVAHMAVLATGEVVAYSWNDGMRRWTGSSWTAVTLPTSQPIAAMTRLANGELAIGVYNNSFGSTSVDILTWSPTTAVWTPHTAGITSSFMSEPEVHLTEPVPGVLVAHGQFAAIGGRDARNVAAFRANQWRALGDGIGAPVFAVLELGDDDVLVAGAFTHVGNLACNRVARRSAGVWSALGSGISGPPYNHTAVLSLLRLANGDILAGGQFLDAGGNPCQSLARWNGTSWSPFANVSSFSGVEGVVTAMSSLPNGDVVIVGSFSAVNGVPAHNVARWNGSTWAAVGPWVNAQLRALAVLPSGEFLVGGDNGLLLRWTGSAWVVPSAPISSAAHVRSILPLPNGDLLVGGSDIVPMWQGLARLSGSSTIGLGMVGGTVYSMAMLPNGDVAVAGDCAAGPVGTHGVARLSGATWSSLAGGIDVHAGPWDAVPQTVAMGTSTLYVGGSMFSAGGVASSMLAELGTTCAASAVSGGSSCAGSGGANVLTATSLPWVGSTFTSTAVGMPNNGIVLRVLGLGTLSLPMPAVLPSGQPGCTLSVTPDLLEAYLPAAGAVTCSLALPNSVALGGQVLHQQVVPLELDAVGNIVTVTGSNRLTLTLGSF